MNVYLVGNQLENQKTQQQAIANAVMTDKPQRFCGPVNSQSD